MSVGSTLSHLCPAGEWRIQKSHYLGFPNEGEMSLSPKELMDFGTDGNLGSNDDLVGALGPGGPPHAEGMKTKVPNTERNPHRHISYMYKAYVRENPRPKIALQGSVPPS